MSNVLEVAKAQIGIEETPRGSNWGPEVKKFLNAAGISVPAPWCMAFVFWCHKQAGVKMPKTASCTFLLNWAKENDRITSDPRPGDIFLLLRKGGHSAFHTGVVRNVSKLYYGTVEGNSNDAGSAEGYEVCARTRSRILSRVAFVRVADD